MALTKRLNPSFIPDSIFFQIALAIILAIALGVAGANERGMGDVAFELGCGRWAFGCFPIVFVAAAGVACSTQEAVM
jgi:hypothetical protein